MIPVVPWEQISWGVGNPKFPPKPILLAVAVWWNKMCPGPGELWRPSLTNTLHFAFQASKKFKT